MPGSSDAYVGGIVAYADDVKREQLGVADELLERHGAVSAEVAEAMAEGARTALERRSRRGDGVAGPGGGTPEKPVGLVYLHAAAPGKGRGRMLDLPGDREAIRSRATAAALHLVRELLSRDSRRTRVTGAASVGGRERPRLFAALVLPRDTSSALVAWQRDALDAVPKSGSSPPANLHVTLAFLGPRPADEIPAIVG